jgi:hypothetical protein
MTQSNTTHKTSPSSSSEMTIPGPSYSNTKNVSRIERWLKLTGRPHSIRGASPYRGVSKNNGNPEFPWRASLKYQGRTYHGGNFATQEEAAAAWNRLVLRYIGPEAEPRLNPVDLPIASEIND